MAPGLPIQNEAAGRHRDSFVGLASSLVASFADPSPLAQEVVARDLADLTPAEWAAEQRAAASAVGSFSAIDADVIDTDSETPNDGAPYLYRRPSAIAYGTGRPALGLAPKEGPPLSRLEQKQSRDAERSLLRDNHLLPPQHAAAVVVAGKEAPAPGFFARVYRRLFSTRVPRSSVDAERASIGIDGTPAAVPAAAGAGGEPTEQTALLAPIGEAGRAGAAEIDDNDDSQLDEQWEAAIEAGQIHTTWQREAKTIAIYSRSLIVTFLLQYSINITAIFAVGHIGKIELGAVSLATMTASITFYAPVQGMATCLDTLCAQAYGSGHRTLVGLQLQRMACFLLVLLVPLECLWLNAESILAIMIPERETARLAGLYLRVLACSMPASAVFECSKRYMQAQGLFMANTYVLLIAAPLNIFLNWLLVWHFELGFIGAPISSAITQWIMPTLLLLYVIFIDGSQCWGGFSKRVFANWRPMIRLALPGMIMVEAEYFAFEILTLAAGQFGTTELAAQSILVTLTSTTFQIPFPVSVAASTRVANLIGAKLPDAARTCAKVAVIAGAIIGALNLTLVSGFRYQIPVLFTNDPDVIEAVAKTIPSVAFLQVFDGLSTIANGLLRGVGRQEVGGYASLCAYYFLGLPVSFGTAFGLGWKLTGLWIGVTIGLFVVSTIEYSYLYYYNWQHAVDEAEQRNASG